MCLCCLSLLLTSHDGDHLRVITRRWLGEKDSCPKLISHLQISQVRGEGGERGGERGGDGREEGGEEVWVGDGRGEGGGKGMGGERQGRGRGEKGMGGKRKGRGRGEKGMGGKRKGRGRREAGMGRGWEGRGRGEVVGGLYLVNFIPMYVHTGDVCSCITQSVY